MRWSVAGAVGLAKWQSAQRFCWENAGDAGTISKVNVVPNRAARHFIASP
jgi:hypothetical protein